MSKVRVYEIASELGMNNRELLGRIQSLGIQVRNHMSALEPAEADRVRRALDKDKAENTVEEVTGCPQTQPVRSQEVCPDVAYACTGS